jgi:succinate dehydrogenase / fumarate reductase flavoprotein subunit
VAYFDGASDVKLVYRPVHLKTLSDDIETIPPKERVY